MGSPLNPFATSLHGNFCPAQARSGACNCQPRCAVCGCVRFCYCLERYEDIARERACEAERRVAERTFAAWCRSEAPVYDDAAADREYEIHLARQCERDQQSADADRGDR